MVCLPLYECLSEADLSLYFDFGLCLFQRLDRKYVLDEMREGIGQRVFLGVFVNQLIPELLQTCRTWWTAK